MAVTSLHDIAPAQQVLENAPRGLPLPWWAKIGAKIVEEADVENEESLDRLFARLKKDWGRIDFVVHAIAFSDKEELKGRYVDTTKANFQRSLTISCYSFTDIARRATPPPLTPHFRGRST